MAIAKRPAERPPKRDDLAIGTQNGPKRIFAAIAPIEEFSAQSGLESGAEGIRTPDLCIANAALSQLSYRPDGAVFYSNELAKGRACQLHP